MTTLAEVLILRGMMPIESIDSVGTSHTDEEALVRNLLDSGTISPAQLASARAAQAGVPFVELVDFAVDHQAVALAPAAICRRHEVLPIAFSEGYLVLAMVDPGNIFALDDIRSATGRQIRVVVAERSDLQTALDRFHRADGELSNRPKMTRLSFAS